MTYVHYDTDTTMHANNRPILDGRTHPHTHTHTDSGQQILQFDKVSQKLRKSETRVHEVGFTLTVSN